MEIATDGLPYVVLRAKGTSVGVRKKWTLQISWSKAFRSKSKYYDVQYMVRLFTGNSLGLLTTTKC